MVCWSPEGCDSFRRGTGSGRSRAQPAADADADVSAEHCLPHAVPPRPASAPVSPVRSPPWLVGCKRERFPGAYTRKGVEGRRLARDSLGSASPLIAVARKDSKGGR